MPREILKDTSEDGAVQIAYDGFIGTGYGEDGDAIMFGGIDEPLAEVIEEDIDEYGNFLTVRYYTANAYVSVDEVNMNYVRIAMGVSNAHYDQFWTEITGYLWANEDLMIGGHDLRAELSTYEGKYCYLEITYRKEVPDGYINPNPKPKSKSNRNW